jgi:hypothetical protein
MKTFTYPSYTYVPQESSNSHSSNPVDSLSKRSGMTLDFQSIRKFFEEQSDTQENEFNSKPLSLRGHTKFIQERSASHIAFSSKFPPTHSEQKDETDSGKQKETLSLQNNSSRRAATPPPINRAGSLTNYLNPKNFFHKSKEGPKEKGKEKEEEEAWTSVPQNSHDEEEGIQHLESPDRCTEFMKTDEEVTNLIVNKKLRKQIIKDLKKLPIPVPPNTKVTSFKSIPVKESQKNGSPDFFPLFNLILKRLLFIRNIVAKSGISNEWTIEFQYYLDLLIDLEKNIDSKETEEEFSQLNLFLKNYDQSLQFSHFSMGLKESLRLIHEAIGGEKNNHAQNIIKYLRSVNAFELASPDVGLPAHPFDLEEKRINEVKSTIQLDSIPLAQESDILSFEYSCHKTLLKSLDKSEAIQIKDRSQMIHQFYHNKLQQLIDQIPDLEEIKVVELHVVSLSPQTKEFLKFIQSRHSILLFPFLQRLNELYQSLVHFLREESKTTLLINKLYYSLIGLINLDRESFEACQIQVEFNDKWSPLNVFNILLKKIYSEGDYFTFQILQQALIGNNHESEGFAFLMEYLDTWARMDFNQVFQDLQKIVTNQTIENLIKKIYYEQGIDDSDLPQLKDVRRTFFGYEEVPTDIPSESSEVLPNLVTINYQPLQLKNSSGTKYEVQNDFFTRLLSSINQKGLNYQMTVKGQKKEVEELITKKKMSSPSMSYLLGFGSIKWRLLGKNLIESLFPKLSSTLYSKSLAIRAVKGVNIHYSINPKTLDFKCNQPLSFTIFSRLYPKRPETFAIDDQRPLANIVFDWIGYLLRTPGDSKIHPRGILRIAKLQFRAEATSKEHRKICKALHVFEIIRQTQFKSSGWLDQFIPRPMDKYAKDKEKEREDTPYPNSPLFSNKFKWKPIKIETSEKTRTFYFKYGKK